MKFPPILFMSWRQDYDIIGVNVFFRKLKRFFRKKTIIGSLHHYSPHWISSYLLFIDLQTRILITRLTTAYIIYIVYAVEQFKHEIYICETNRGIQVASFKVWSLSSHCSKSSSILQNNYFFFKRVMQTRVNSETITNLPYLLLNDASSRRISRSFAHNHSESPYPL